MTISHVTPEMRRHAKREHARQSGCMGKEPFTERARAEAVRKRMQRNTRGPINTYRCRFCRAWHVGRAKPEVRR